MKKKLLLILLVNISFSAVALAKKLQELMMSPGSLSATSITLLWTKPENRKVAQYYLFLNGKQLATADKCNYRFTGLLPETKYSFVVKAADEKGKLTRIAPTYKFITKAQGKFLDVRDFGANGDGKTLNTKAIQKAIDACKPGSTVLIPKGIFLSGAVFLKSHMTLEIAKGGVLKGSKNEKDYLPYVNNRFEGWEMKTYASLLNAGVMDNRGGFSVEELAIKGEGTISGGGSVLGKAMIEKGGLRSRGRLILLMNCKNVEIQGLQIEESPCWTIHYIYSKGVSCHDLSIVSTARNGDGLDPDSSDDSYIFNCTFSTGDDCIAIKSGKNPEGFAIAKPTRNVNITNCEFLRGHGISIGSEMSGGVSDVLVQDCKAGNLLHGLQIKGTKERGGYVRNVTVADCQLLKITIFSAVNYNNDGNAAPEIPTFENFVFRRIDLSKAGTKEPVMNLNGFTDANHKLKNCSFSDIILPSGATVFVKDAEKLKFVNVGANGGIAPKYEILNSVDIRH